MTQHNETITLERQNFIDWIMNKQHEAYYYAKENVEQAIEHSIDDDEDSDDPEIDFDRLRKAMEGHEDNHEAWDSITQEEGFFLAYENVLRRVAPELYEVTN